MLAKRIGMKESYVSRVLSGTANLTLRTICRIEAGLEEEILTAPWVEHKRRAHIVSFQIEVVSQKPKSILAYSLAMHEQAPTISEIHLKKDLATKHQVHRSVAPQAWA